MTGKLTWVLAPAILALGLSAAVEAGQGKGYYGGPAKHGHKYAPPGHRIGPPHRHHHRHGPRRAHYAGYRHGHRHGYRKAYPRHYGPPVRYYHYPAPRYYPVVPHGVIYYSRPGVGVSLHFGY